MVRWTTGATALVYVTMSRTSADRPRPDYRPPLTASNVFKRLGYLVLIALAAAFMVLAKADTRLVDGISLEVSQVAAPLADGLARPVEEMVDAVEAIRRVTALNAENERLRAERDQLFQWQAVARRLEAENTALRKLLNAVPDGSTLFVTARVLADTSGAFARSELVNAGEEEGVARGQTVVAAGGLVGRVVGVSSHAARVLLISDLNSRVPVLVGTQRLRAILAGDNSDQPKLLYLPPHADVSVGDPVVTSSEAGVFPADIPVGVVATADAAAVTVSPFVSPGGEPFVRIIDYRPAVLMRPPPAADGGHGEARPGHPEDKERQQR